MTDKQRIAELERQVAELEEKNETLVIMLQARPIDRSAPHRANPWHGSTWCNCPQCTRRSWAISMAGPSSGNLTTKDGVTLTFDDETTSAE